MLIFWAIMFLGGPVLSRCQSTDWFCASFATTDATCRDNISLDGDAKILENGILQLTSDGAGVLGHAFYSSAVRFRSSPEAPVFSFSTSFALVVGPSKHPKYSGHGLAFAISRNRTFPRALPNHYLGLFDANILGNVSDHVAAVEFDTVRDLDVRDINNNHVGLDLNSVVSNASAEAAYIDEAGHKRGINLTSGSPILAWVDYDSATARLNVTLSPTSAKPKTPILSVVSDLSPIVEEFMYVGFSASTGVLASSHYVLGWSFRTNGEARSLDLNSLSSLLKPKKSHTTMIAAVSAATAVTVIFTVSVAIYLTARIRGADEDVVEAWEFDIRPQRFRYKELKRATEKFSDARLLGFGGSGKVYKATLPNTKTQVAVKRICPESKRGSLEFLSEIESIGRLRHRNLVQLIGWCRRGGDLLLVYDYMPNGSLDKYLFDDNPGGVLSWEQRFNIIKGVASGLLYLHGEWEQTVIHRDVKAANVLLDSDLNGRLGDFGLAKLYEHGSNPRTTRVVGTLGYLAPELTRSGKPTAFSDVFAFGALLLEVACGRRPIEPKAIPEELVLVDWVWEKWKSGTIMQAVDPRLMGQYKNEEVVVVLKLGLMCSHARPTQRPTMRQVVRYLEGEVELPLQVAPPDGCCNQVGGGSL